MLWQFRTRAHHRAGSLGSGTVVTIRLFLLSIAAITIYTMRTYGGDETAADVKRPQ